MIRSEPGPVWRITLDRPEARNAVTEAMLTNLAAALADAAADPDARVVLLAGAGGHFCAGADLDEVARGARADGFGYARALEDVLAALADHPLPVVARVEAAPLSVRGSKRAIAAVLGKLSIDREAEGYRLAEVDLMAADALASEDLAEGLRARRERRPPRFRGA